METKNNTIKKEELGISSQVLLMKPLQYYINWSNFITRPFTFEFIQLNLFLVSY